MYSSVHYPKKVLGARAALRTVTGPQVAGSIVRGDDAGMPIPLMLATLTDRRDFGDDWLLERKLDGERCVARKDGSQVRLESRTGKDLTGTYPEVHAAVAAQWARGLLLDG